MNKVSILIPVYNESLFIEESLKSIFQYDYENLSVQVVVVDDHSTDGTIDILKKYKEQYAPSQSSLLIATNCGKGKNKAFNRAFDLCDGDFICFMGGDDKLNPASLKRRVLEVEDFVENNHSYDCVSLCKIKTFSVYKKFDSILIPRKKGLGSQSGGSICMPRKLVEKIFPIPESLPNEDSWISLYIDLMGVHKIHIDEVGLYYRIHENNSHSRMLAFKEARAMLLKRGRAKVFFYSRYEDSLDSDAKKTLLSKIYLWVCVYNEMVIPIFFVKHVPWRERLSALQYASAVFFNVKAFFYKYIAGR